MVKVKGQHSLRMEENERKAVSLNRKNTVLCDILNVMDRINAQTRHAHLGTCTLRTEYGVISRTQFKRSPTGEEIC